MSQPDPGVGLFGILLVLTVAPPCGSYACCPPLRPRVLPLLLLGLLCSVDCAGAMPINPRTPAETRRVFERSLRPDLASGRPVTDATFEFAGEVLASFHSLDE